MLTCPNQHESKAADFCSVCGAEMTGGAAAAVEECPICRAERAADAGVFCEGCGYNFQTGAPGEPFPVAENAAAPPEPVSGAALPTAGVEASAATEAVVQEGEAAPAADAWEILAAVDSAVGNVPADELPQNRAERVFPLDRDELLIGRRSVRRGIHPEISLEDDDAVSHRHAKLVRQPDGTFALSDLGSSNGTSLNGAELKANAPAPLHAGDQITMGRWTRLTVRVCA